MFTTRCYIWEQYEIDYLINNYANKTSEQNRIDLFKLNKENGVYPDRTVIAIRNKAKSLGVFKTSEVINKNRKAFSNNYRKLCQIRAIRIRERKELI